MKISIIIPVYNVAPYIEECLDSVIDQTYKGEMECILVDDCGTDDSVAICERVISRYNGPINFRIVHHVHNRGLSAARNTGIDASTGDWLYFLDSDDSIIPECLEQMVGCLEKYPDSEIVFAGAKSSDGSLEYMMNYENRCLPPYSNNTLWIKCAMLYKTLHVTAWNKLVKREVILRNLCYFEEGMIHEDEVWNVELTKILNKIAICAHNTYFYRIRSNSIITSCDEERFHNNNVRLYRKLIKVIPSYNKSLYVRKIWMDLMTFYRKCLGSNFKQFEIRELLRMLLQESNYRMILPIFISAYMPYNFFKLRLINFFFSRYDKIPLLPNPVIEI